MGKRAIGIDIGGTGIKGAVVDVKTGKLIGERLRLETPTGGRPQDVANSVAKIVRDLGGSASMQVGLCFPAVVQHGVTKSAANISLEWIGLDAETLFEKKLGCHVHVLNDADAAGMAEAKFGAARGRKGLTIMTTLGTGIGTALIYNGELIPNAELGHIEIDCVDYESMAAFSAKERGNLSWVDWAARLQKYYSKLEALLIPDLIVVGGGVSKQHYEFLPLLRLKTEIVAAETRNSAGIIGAAAQAYKNRDS